MIEQSEVQIQAKQIMDTFVKALENAELPDTLIGVKREKQVRSPKNVDTSSADFSKKMLHNAPEVKDNCIVAEKKSW